MGSTRHAMAIYLHKACFDGCASAAIAAWLLRARAGASAPAILPVGYGEAAAWLARPLEPSSCVVDFLYHPDAAYWWDHHENPFRNPAWYTEYRARSSPLFRWDPDAGSCAALMARSIHEEGLELPGHLERTARWADLIDRAAYPTPEAAVIRPSEARRLSLSLRTDASAPYQAALVRALGEADVEEVARWPPFAGAVERTMERYAQGVETMRSSARVERNVVLYTFDDQHGLVDGLVPFYLHRDVEYSVGIFRQDAQIKVTANENPWHRPLGPDLGRLFARYGGGGHHDIGSVILDRDGVQPERVVHEVLRVLQAKDG
jgi:hypothetical protein